MKSRQWICIFATLAVVGSAAAEDMRIKPGKWEFRSTMSMMGQGKPTEHVNQDCMKEESLSPQVMMKNMQQSCELLETTSTSDSLSWNVRCAAGGNSSTGTGSVRATGDESLSGVMDMTFSYGDQQMTMNMQWNGTYLGPCD